MSLPVLTIPEYDLKLHSLPKPIKYRPYLVGEEKLMLMAQQSEDPKEIRDTVKRVLSACTYNKVNIGDLPSFDLELLYLSLRAKSVNNIVTVNYVCRNLVNDKECGTSIPVHINLDNIKLTVHPEHTNKIWLNDSVGMTLVYPTKERLDGIQSNNGVFGVELLMSCIGSIFTKSGTVHEAQDIEQAELQKFVESLTLSQFQLAQQFFDTMPQLFYETEFKCTACGYEQTIKISGLMDFFV